MSAVSAADLAFPFDESLPRNGEIVDIPLPPGAMI